MVRPEVLRRRLAKLDEYLAILNDLASSDRGEFISNPQLYGSAERFLQLAVEALLDMGSHAISELGLGSIEAYRDIPRLLHEHGYVPADLAERWVRMIGLRNILVHEYLDIDRRIVHEVLVGHHRDLEALRDVFLGFL